MNSDFEAATSDSQTKHVCEQLQPAVEALNRLHSGSASMADASSTAADAGGILQ